MNIIHKIQNSLFLTLKKLNYISTVNSPEDILVTFPPQANMGELSTNISMILSSKLKISPETIANKIIEELKLNSIFKNVNYHKPGFINLSIQQDLWLQTITEILEKRDTYGYHNYSKKIHMEYLSVNPTGPLHIGHVRGAIWGDTLSRLLKLNGYDVHREYYINDKGKQIVNLIKSVQLRYYEIFGNKIEIPEDLYPGKYVIDIAEKLKTTFSDTLLKISDQEFFKKVKDIVITNIMDNIKHDLSTLKIDFDEYLSEDKTINDQKIEETLEILQKQNLIYKGKVAESSFKKKDKKITAATENTSEDESKQIIFKSSQFGDDKDRVLKTSQNTWTYFASDIAHHLHKYKQGFEQMYVLLGADHIGYIKRLQSAVSAISNNQASLHIDIYQVVNLLNDQQVIKMSKRKGNIVRAKDMIDAIGVDALRFFMITKNSDAKLDLDLSVIQEQSRINPIFYIQYAYARATSVINKFEESQKNKITSYFQNFELNNLNSDYEINLIKHIAVWPDILQRSISNYKLSIITDFLYKIASLFHSLWNYNNNGKTFRFFIEDDLELTKSRVILAQSIKYLLKSGLTILNITPMEKM